MSDPADPADPGTAAAEDCLRLTGYFGERQRTQGRFTADALLDLFGEHRIETSILLRATEGFGASGRPRTDRSLTLSEDLPLIAIAVDTRSRIEAVLDPASALIRAGLVTVQRTRLVTAAGPGSPTAVATELAAGLAADDPGGEGTKLTVFLGRQQRAGRVPAFVAVCDLLHRRGLAGATALLGVDGTARGRRERAVFFGRNAGTPMMVIAVGSGARIGAVLPELGALLGRPRLTLERVRICKRDGELLGRPAAPGPAPGSRLAPGSGPSPGQDGEPPGRKLMVYTSESAPHDGQPIHRAIVRRLRAAGISGATTQRGIWGFHGNQAPHGDRLLQLGRRVPVVSVVIDAADRIEAAFDIIDELTRDQGLVTSEAVTDWRPIGGGAGVTGARADSPHRARS